MLYIFVNEFDFKSFIIFLIISRWYILCPIFWNSQIKKVPLGQYSVRVPTRTISATRIEFFQCAWGRCDFKKLHVQTFISCLDLRSSFQSLLALGAHVGKRHSCISLLVRRCDSFFGTKSCNKKRCDSFFLYSCVRHRKSLCVTHQSAKK